MTRNRLRSGLSTASADFPGPALVLPAGGGQPGPPARLFLAAAGRDLIEAVLDTPGWQLVGQAERAEQCLPIIGAMAADALLLRAEPSGQTAMLARHLRLVHPQLVIGLLLPAGSSPSPDLEALGVLVWPAGTPPRDALRELLARACGGPGTAAPAREVAAAAVPSFRRHRLQAEQSATTTPRLLTQQVVAIASPKGGVGKTFLATNLAVTLAARTPARVVLVDLDLNSADVGVHLDLLEGPTLVDLLPYLPETGSADLGRFLVTHRISGLKVLLGPARAELGALVKVEHLRRIFEWLRRDYHFIFIDLPPDGGGELVQECTQAASRIILVTTTDAASLRQARLALEALQGQGVPQDRLLLVVNQVYDGCPVTLREVGSFLGIEPAGELVSDRRLVEEATLEGKPVVLAAPTHPLVIGVHALAAQLCPGLPVLAPDSRRRVRLPLPGWLRRFGQ
ncbi:MAG TPA: hypothetical protein DEQ28_03585 [Clostridiales bacterium]|nr:hypothetical protein [Clostridiales bacterium]